MIRENWGGSEELWAAMAETALKEGHEVFHSTFKFPEYAGKEKSLIDQGLRVITRKGYFKPRINPLVKKIKIGWNFIFNRITNPFGPVFDQKPDFILYNGTCYSITQEKYLLPLLLSSGVKFGLLSHFAEKEELDKREKEILTDVYSKASHLFFISKRSIITIEKHLNFKLHQAIVVRNPVNMNSTDIISYPRNNIIEMAVVGNLNIAHKGQHLLLEVLSTDKWKERQWKLNIYGIGPDEKKLKEITFSLGLNEKVIFHGKTNDIRGVWLRNNILIMPSLMEGMPLAVVEAMLCGRPCVVTDVGDHSEWIRNGIDGYIAEKAEVSSIYQAMEKAWENKNNWESMGRSAHENALRLYDPNPGKTLLEYIKH